MDTLWLGFEKRAYDYAHEKRELERHYTLRSEKTPMQMGRASLLGAGFGVAAGGILGAVKTKRISGALIGSLLGGGLGAGSGALIAMSDKLGIQEAKRIMAMPKQERADYLHHLAYSGEISQREAQEWARTHAMTSAMRESNSRPNYTTIVMPSAPAQAKVPTGNCQNCGSSGVTKTSVGWACEHCGSYR